MQHRQRRPRNTQRRQPAFDPQPLRIPLDQPPSRPAPQLEDGQDDLPGSHVIVIDLA